jgi:hypothetical protein
MIPYPPIDLQPFGPTTSVSGPPAPLNFSFPVDHRNVAFVPYNAWSNGYTGSIYISPASVTGSTAIVVIFPPNVAAFYLYIQSSEIGPITGVVVANSPAGATPANITVSGFDPSTGEGNARYVGVYSSDNFTPISTVTLIMVTPPGSTFAIGEFGIAFLAPVPCLHPSTKVLTANGEKPITEIKRKDIVKGVNGEDILVIHNLCFLPAKKYVKIPKDLISVNVPSTDLLIRRDHAILVDGKKVMPQRIVGREMVELEEPVPAWSLCTKRKTFVMMNGVPVATHGFKQYLNNIADNKKIPHTKQ